MIDRIHHGEEKALGIGIAVLMRGIAVIVFAVKDRAVVDHRPLSAGIIHAAERVAVFLSDRADGRIADMCKQQFLRLHRINEISEKCAFVCADGFAQNDSDAILIHHAPAMRICHAVGIKCFQIRRNISLFG